MEHAEILVIDRHNFPEKLGILLLKHGCLEFGIGNRFCIFVSCLPIAIYGFWMSKHNVKPNVWLNLFRQMSIAISRYALNWVFGISEGHEEGDDTLRYSALLSSLVDVDSFWIEEQDLAVSEFFFRGFPLLWSQGRVDGEYAPNG